MAERSRAGAVSRVKPICLAGLLVLAAMLAGGTVRAAEEPVVPPKSVRWGPKDESGLQLGAWLDPHRPILRCVVRNQGDHAVRYSDYLLGYWESVTIKARSNPKDQWRPMAVRNRGLRPVKSAGASASDVHLIDPKQQMLPVHREGQKQAVAAKRPEWTFSVNLWEYEWPGSWTGTVEVMVRQKLGEDGSRDTWAGVLESGAVEFPVGDLGADPLVGVTKALLPEGWVVQKVEDNTHPFYLEKGSGKAIYVGPPLQTIDPAKVKTPHKAVFWIMPQDYRGRPLPGAEKGQTSAPTPLQSTKTAALYWWGSAPNQVRDAVLSALYWTTAAAPAKR